MARIQDKEGFFGMDMDTATDKMKPGDYRFALNIRVGTTDGSNVGRVENIRGNVQVTASLPSGDNKVIGTFEDNRGRTVIYFVWNSMSNHSIQQYFIDTNKIQEIVKDPVLNFQKNKLITGVDMISTILEWTENFNPPRAFNIDKANETEKLRVWHLYFPDDAFDFQTGCNYVFTVKNAGGNIVAGGYNVCSGGGSPSDDGELPSGMRNLADDMNTATAPGFRDLNQGLVAEACGKFMKITSKVFGESTIEITTTDNHDFRLIAQNFYSGPFKEEFFDLIEYPQICQPRVEYKIDSEVTYNFLLRKTFQFRTRLVYDDDQKSVWGSISELPIDSFGACSPREESPFNYIEVDFSSDRLNDDNSLSVVSKVDLAVREGNSNTWKKIITLEQADFAFDQTFKFFNNTTPTEISQTEADKPFDNVPLLSGALSIIKGRTVLGNNTEGFDVPCVDAKITQTFNDPTPLENTTSITGRIRIVNPLSNNSDWGNNQPIVDYSGTGDAPVFGGIGGSSITDIGSKYNQSLPLKGFTAYLAGTSFSDVSVQDRTEADKFNVSILPGDVFDGSTSVKRGRIKDAMDASTEVFSTFTIDNVPEGRYILRLASHLCIQGDGGIFDIDGSDLRYQRTSTRTVDFLGFTTAANFQFQGKENELYINIAVGGGTIDIGTIEVRDLSDPSLGQGSTAAEGYLFDPEFETVDADTIRDKPNMETQEIRLVDNLITPFVTGFTDHNGYFYFAIPKGGLGSLFIDSTSIQPTGFISRLVIRAFSQAIFEGGLEGSLSTISDGDIGSDAEVTQLIAYNYSNDVTSYARTIVNGSVLAPDGKGISDVNVVISENTRQERTQADGSYSILVYADGFVNNNDRVEDLSFTYIGACAADLGLDPTVTINVTPFDQTGPFNNDNPFTAPTLNAVLFDAFFEVDFKRGGNYKSALGYFDKAGRFTTLASEERLGFYIPFFNEDLNTYFPIQFPTSTFKFGSAVINWEIFHEPPPWAVAYRWYRTQNTAYNFYLQWVANDVEYVSRFDTDADVPIKVSFGSSEAKEIYINIENLQFFKDENSDSLLGYTFQVGDRIRIMADENGVFFEEFFDFPIKEQRGFDIIIDADNTLPELKRGFLIEIYTPKLVREDDLFFEVGPCYDIVNGQHSVTSGTFTTEGDNYTRQRVMVAQDDSTGASGVDRFRRSIESASISDFYVSQVSGIGRTNIIDPDSREVVRGSELKFGNLFIENTNINGLASFDPLNSKPLPQEFGGITKIAFVNNVMLVLFPSKTFSLYINRSMVTDVIGGVLQAESDQFFSQENELNGDYGTANPESFVIYKGRAFWWDVFAGSIVQYDSNGTDKINYQMDRYFAKKGRDLLGLMEQSEVVAIYDSYFNSYIVTFRPIADTSAPIDIQTGETVAYNTEIRRWITFFSFIPQFYGRSGKRIVTFEDGELWLHNESNTYNTIYGSAVPSQIRVIANAAPDSMKIWFNITQRTTSPWPCPEISNDGGQLTNLIESDFENKEGDEWHAFLLKDQNTPNIDDPLIQGDEMRSRVLELLMQINSTELEVLSNVDVYATPSERTNK